MNERIVDVSRVTRFQFTHPGRGATWNASHVSKLLPVSIHAPREGCDLVEQRLGEESKGFQFTHPGRGATSGSIFSAHSVTVSIHAPREGCDLSTSK